MKVGGGRKFRVWPGGFAFANEETAKSFKAFERPSAGS